MGKERAEPRKKRKGGHGHGHLSGSASDAGDAIDRITRVLVGRQHEADLHVYAR